MTANRMQKPREGFRDHLDQKARLTTPMMRRDQSAGDVLGVLEKIPWKDLLMLKSGGQCEHKRQLRKIQKPHAGVEKPKLIQEIFSYKHISGLGEAVSLGQLLHFCIIQFAADFNIHVWPK